MAEESKQLRPTLQRGEFLLAIVAVVPALYWAMTYTGPYRWFAELQLKWMGAYEGGLTFVLTMFVILIPLLGVQYAARKLAFAKKGAEGTEPLWWQSFARHFGDLMLVLVGLICIGVGAFIYYRVVGEAQATAVHVREMEAGKKPQRLWLEVSGRTIFEDAAASRSIRPTTTFPWSRKTGARETPSMFIWRFMRMT